jgi:Spy/CpxP family protein refolding chaperone
LLLLTLLFSMAQSRPPHKHKHAHGHSFGVPPEMLASAQEVQDALQLSAVQKEKIEEINRDARRMARELFQESQRDFAHVLVQGEQVHRKVSKQLAEVLTTEQEKRLVGITIQVNGARTMANPAVAKELGVTEEQKAQLRKLRMEAVDETRRAWDEIREKGLDRHDMRDKMNAVREKADKEILAILTAEQQQKLEELKGSPLEIDMAQFVRPRGRFDGRRRHDERPHDRN